MFEYYDNMHVYCLVVGADEPLGSSVFVVLFVFFFFVFFFQNHYYSVLLPISCKIFPLNDILTVFPIQMRPMLTLP